MNKKLAVGMMIAAIGSTAACGSTALSARSATAADSAPPPPGVATPLLQHALFNAFHLKAHADGPNKWATDLWTHGQTDLYVAVNDFNPGASTGWHSHPGPSLVLVTAGSVTDYSSSEPGCPGQTYSKGQGFLDPGGSEVHMVRNNGTVDAETIAVQFIPHGDSRKIPATQPPGCSV
jgi:quercetin dioxygenase-like cupin family protein